MEARTDRPEILQPSHGAILPAAAATLVTLIALAVWVGWFLREPGIVRLYPGFAPMQFNTALGFVLCGTGLLALAANRRVLAAAAGSAAMLLGFLTLAQYLAGVDLGIDELFIRDFPDSKTLFPGRMAPNTSFGFILFGLALLATTFQARDATGKRFNPTELLALCVLGMSAIALVGHALGTDNTSAGLARYVTYMALHTTICFAIASAGLISWARRCQFPSQEPVWIVIALYTAVIGLELYFPSGVAIGIAYALPVMASFWFSQRKSPYVVATVSTLLVFAGPALSRSIDASSSTVTANLILSVLAVWVTAIVVQRQRKAYLDRQTTVDELAHLNAELAHETGLLRTAERIGKTGHWSWDMASETVNWSDGACRILGIDMAGSRMSFAEAFRMIHSDDQARAAAVVEAAIYHGQPYDLEWRILRPDGAIKHVHLSGEIERDQNGVPTSAHGTFHDITDFKHATLALEQKADQLTRAELVGRSGTWERDLETGELTWSEGMVALIGRQPPGDPVTDVVSGDFIHPEDREEAVALVERAAAQGRSFDAEWRILRYDGEVRCVQVRGDFVLGRSGKPIRLTGALHDVTEIKEAERHLRESEALINEILASAAVGMITIDPYGTVETFNSMAEKLFGYVAEEVIGNNVSMLMAEPYRGEHDGYLQRFLTTGEAHIIGGPPREVTGMHKDGHLFDVDLAIAEMPTTDKRRFVGSLFDVSARKEAERELRLLNERYQLASEVTKAATWELWPEERRILSDDNLPRLFGTTTQSEAFDTWLGFIDPEDRPHMEHQLAQIVSGEREILDLTLRARRADGTLIWVAPFGRAVRDNDGLWIIGRMRDVTAEKSARLALERNERNLAAAQELARLGSWDWDIATDAFSCSRELYRIYGRDPDGTPLDMPSLLEALNPDDRNRAQTMMERLIVGKNTDMEGEYLINGVEGEQLWIRTTTHLQLDEAGRPSSLNGIVQDITAAKLARREADLRDQAIKTAVSPIVLTDLDARYVYVNDAYMDLIGATDPGELIGKPAGLLQLDIPDRHAIRDQIVATGIWRGEGRITRQDGHHRDVLITSSVVRSADGQPYRILTSYTDISERHAAEVALAEQAEELKRSNADLERFAYIASHDLRAPLRGIDTLASWIEEDLGDALDGDPRENMTLLRSRIKRLENLLEALLQYSRVGRIHGKTETAPLAELVHETVGLLGIAERFEVTVSEPMPTIETDRSALQQVLVNLIGNAVKHHDQDTGTIAVSVMDLEDLVEFRIADDGPGIPDEFRERVFEMFRTLKPRDELEASGMGLAIVKKAVERQGGTIHIESGDGSRGTVFVFTWPKCPR